VLIDAPSEVYDPRPTRAAGRLEQILTLNDLSPDEIKRLNPNDTLVRTALVFYAGQKSQQTSALVAKCSFHVESNGRIAVTLDDGRAIQIDLSQLKISL
jgi:hypothetical protein